MALIQTNVYPEVTTDYMIDRIVEGMYIHFYRENAGDTEFLNKIEKAWKDKTGTDFPDIEKESLMIEDKTTFPFLNGPPGNGKTTTFREASKIVASSLGMKFVDHVADSYQAGDNDFLFITQEMSGEVSNIAFGGIPMRDGDVMKMLHNNRLMQASRAKASMLLLDDFPNAAPNVQTTALSVLEEGTFQGLDVKRSFKGLTGNLGAADGTTGINLASTANVNRVENYYVEDTYENWAERTRKKYNDSWGDAGITNFLDSNKELFKQLPTRSTRGAPPEPFASPRSWSKVVTQLRRILYRHQANLSSSQCLNEIDNTVSSLVGRKTGQIFSSWYHARLQSAEPLAKALVDNGKFTKEQQQKFDKKWGNGLNAEGMEFGNLFITCVADKTVEKIVDDPEKMDDYIKRMGKASTMVHEGMTALGTDQFANRLRIRSPKICDPQHDESKKDAKVIITTNVKREMAKSFADSENMDQDTLQAFIEGITNYAESATTKRQKRKKKA